MKNDLEETVIAAFMNKQPVVLVEGQDDIKFYDNIATLNEKTVDVQAIEMIDGYAEGCEHVCNAMDEISLLIQNDSRLKGYAIGIIDKDVRDYLNEVPSNDNLLILKYYSYETHLITDVTIKRLIEQLTKVPGSLITDHVIDIIKQGFSNQSRELYYFSLEALKKRVDASYQANVEYGEKGGALIGRGGEYKWGLIAHKVTILDQFASRYNINPENLKLIVKGKWYLEAWCDYLIKKVRELHSLCGTEIPKCKYCDAGNEQKCLWRVSSTFQREQIKSLLYSRQFIDKDEVKYISDFMREKLAG
ncbi:hypothetical protein CC1_04430 [Coprococcus catus GD/7]|uniref:DUF4435 domain-containing protein n=1 Tax=Coprococcus catus GD/7 TaxID=717962 RepID=D4J4V0_9FIRM|nr:DUF4435 domain-containing protein [Coprococcus catus]CBK79371.1 hypothetical protein CC1_04430 [Coprococcus catus GD/7]